MNDLLAAQRNRFAKLDSALPTDLRPPEGEWIDAQLPDGSIVAGILYRAYYGPNTEESLWEPRESFELTPLIGDAGCAGMDALLNAFRSRTSGQSTHLDSACVVSWPSRDTEMARVFLDHGLVPLNILAIRRRDAEAIASTRQHTNTDDFEIREAREADLEELLKLAAAELRYSSHVGTSVVRENASELLARSLRRSIVASGKIWLAESAGLAVGLAQCRVVRPSGGNSIDGKVRDGHWGYVSTISVAPETRCRGIGGALMAVAHRDLYAEAVVGTCLFYHPANPLSPAFWHRRHYRPLWTKWMVRPASALR